MSNGDNADIGDVPYENKSMSNVFDVGANQSNQDSSKVVTLPEVDGTNLSEDFLELLCIF